MAKTARGRSHSTVGSACLACSLVLAASLQLCPAGALRAQETAARQAPHLRFQQFDRSAAPQQPILPHRPHPFGVYRTDTLNKTGPEYYGWTHVTPNQSWRGSSTNMPSRQRYGLPGGQ